MAIFRLGRTAVVAAALGVAAAPLLMLGGTAPSGADTSPPTGGWYWAGQPGAQPPPVGQPPTLPAPDVPAGDVASGYRPTGPDKETFLHLADQVASGSTVSSVILKLKEDTAGGNVAADQGKINAKLVTDFWLDGAAGTSLDQAPKVDESQSVAGTRDADGTWTFDLTPIAQQWASGTANNGVGLIPDQSGGTFQVVWKLSDAAVDVQTSSSSSSSDSSSSGFVGADSSGSSSSGTSSGASGTTASLPSDPGTSSSFTPSGSGSLGGDTSTLSPTVDTPAPATAAPAAPTPAGGAGGPQVALSPATKKVASHKGLPAGFFLAGIAALGVLGAVGVSLGDMGEPDVPREGSVVRRLERRVASIR